MTDNSPAKIELIGVIEARQTVMVLSSNVTAPLCAKAAPQSIPAPVSSVMLVSATMSPTNAVVVPSVAELPTLKNTLLP